MLTWVADMGICSSCINPLSLMVGFNLFIFCPASEKTESIIESVWEMEVAGHKLSGISVLWEEANSCIILPGKQVLLERRKLPV